MKLYNLDTKPEKGNTQKKNKKINSFMIITKHKNWIQQFILKTTITTNHNDQVWFIAVTQNQHSINNSINTI